jgi:phosphohistidine phosphatase
MRCYLLRHAEAVPRGTSGYRHDAQRPLTEAGHEQARRTAEGLKRLRIPVGAVVTSPLLRAQQTAEHVIRTFGLGGVQELAALEPEANPQLASSALHDLAKHEHVVLVGHEPHLGSWLSWLVTGEGDLRCLFKKSGAACVELDRVPPLKGSATLRWFLTPKQLALIGENE